MATLMEFASSSLDRDGSSRVAPGAAPHLGLMPPVLHWGSAARDVLDQSGKRCVKLFVMATKGCATRALDMAVESTSLCKEGMLILDELSMRGSSVSSDTPLDSGICSLWGTAQNGGFDLLLVKCVSVCLCDSRTEYIMMHHFLVARLPNELIFV